MIGQHKFSVGKKFWSWKFSTFNNDIFGKFSVRGNGPQHFYLSSTVDFNRRRLECSDVWRDTCLRWHSQPRGCYCYRVFYCSCYCWKLYPSNVRKTRFTCHSETQSSSEKTGSRLQFLYYACILKAHSHSMSGGLIWASLECQCCFWITGGWVVAW